MAMNSNHGIFRKSRLCLVPSHRADMCIELEPEQFMRHQVCGGLLRIGTQV
jgi:hypothetical protein